MRQYAEMIEDALIQLSDRKGSSRVGLWKYVNAKYPEADYKQFLIRLKKLSHEKSELTFEHGRYKLTQNHKVKLLRALDKGSKTKKRVQKTKATMKKSKKKQKKQRKEGASVAKKSAKKGGNKKSGKSGKSAMSNKKGGAKSTNKKGGRKAAGSKRTKGSKVT
jgi:histone H1/5